MHLLFEGAFSHVYSKKCDKKMTNLTCQKYMFVVIFCMCLILVDNLKRTCIMKKVIMFYFNF